MHSMLALVALIGGLGSVQGLPDQLLPQDAQRNSYFGVSVDVSGDTAVIGADRSFSFGRTHAGGVYVAERNGNHWAITQKLAAPSYLVSGERFGYSVAISGNDIIVGAPYADSGATNAGRVYFFTRNALGMPFKMSRYYTDPYANARLGYSVAISDDYAIASQPWYQNRGAINTFRKSGTSWIKNSGRILSPSATSDEFGWSVSLSGMYMAVGARRSRNNEGAVYMYQKTTSTIGYTYRTTLRPAADGTQYFGTSVSLSGSTLAVGGPKWRAGSGRVWMYSALNPWQWQNGRILEGDYYHDFGHSVAVEGNILVVGSIHAPGFSDRSGSFTVYQRREINGVWYKRVELGDRSSDPFNKLGQKMGWSVAVSGDNVLVGAPEFSMPSINNAHLRVGSVYTYSTHGLAGLDKLPGNLKSGTGSALVTGGSSENGSGGSESKYRTPLIIAASVTGCLCWVLSMFVAINVYRRAACCPGNGASQVKFGDDEQAAAMISDVGDGKSVPMEMIGGDENANDDNVAASGARTV